MKKIFILALAFVMIVPLTMAAAINVTGDWEMTMTSPRGEMKQDLSFIQEGEKLKVTIKSQRGETAGEGTVKGDEIEWKITRQTQRGEFSMTYKGKVVDENNMKGTIEGGFGGGRGQQAPEWKAVRKPK